VHIVSCCGVQWCTYAQCAVQWCVCVCVLEMLSGPIQCTLCHVAVCNGAHTLSVWCRGVCVVCVFLKCCLDQYSAHCVMLRCAIVRIRSVCGAVVCVCVLEMLSGPLQCTLCHVAVCNGAHTLSVWCRGVCVRS